MKSKSINVDEVRPMLGRAIWSYDNNVIIIKDWTTDDCVYIKNESGDMFNEVAMYLNRLGISIDAYSVLKDNELLIFTKNFDIKLQMDNFGV